MTEQQITLQNLKDKLGRYHRCAMLRPTGFGKTWILTELIRDYYDVLYIYPSAVVKDTVVSRYESLYGTDSEEGGVDAETEETAEAVSRIPGCTLMTYAKLARMDMLEIQKLKPFGLIVFDEMQRMGAPKARGAIEQLLAINLDADIAGATATPNRMDGQDVTSLFFSDITVYRYTLQDAVADGILQKPYYCYCSYDVEGDLKDACLTAGEDQKDPEVAAVLSAKKAEMSKLFGMPQVIRSTCDRYAHDTSYMKFIVFFSSLSHMYHKSGEVIGWFQEAYPDHTVSMLPISSRNSEESNNTEMLPLLTRKENHIDLIGCIDMLNLGYHVDDQTGIVMYRCTQSSTIFVQQMGRVLSAGAEHPGIIFDTVDNLHRKALYDLNCPQRRRKPHTGYFLSEKGEVLYQAKSGPVPTQYICQDGIILDRHGNKTTLVLAKNGHDIIDKGDPSIKDNNKVTADNIHVTGNIASYREFLAKAVAEPMSQRCRSALALHFRSWCRQHGIDCPMTQKQMQQLTGLSKKDFYRDFCTMLEKNQINYPLQDAEKLLSIGTDGTSDVPLAICAQAKNVSVAQILDMIENQ